MREASFGVFLVVFLFPFADFGRFFHRVFCFCFPACNVKGLIFPFFLAHFYEEDFLAIMVAI